VCCTLAELRPDNASALSTRYRKELHVEVHAKCGGCRASDAHLVASPRDRKRIELPEERFSDFSSWMDTMWPSPRMRPRDLNCFAWLPPLLSFSTCIEGRTVRHGMSLGRSGDLPRDPHRCFGHIVGVRPNCASSGSPHAPGIQNTEVYGSECAARHFAGRASQRSVGMSEVRLTSKCR
jgi:hypothetical protein